MIPIVMLTLRGAKWISISGVALLLGSFQARARMIELGRHAPGLALAPFFHHRLPPVLPGQRLPDPKKALPGPLCLFIPSTSGHPVVGLL